MANNSGNIILCFNLHVVAMLSVRVRIYISYNEAYQVDFNIQGNYPTKRPVFRHTDLVVHEIIFFLAE